MAYKRFTAAALIAWIAITDTLSVNTLLTLIAIRITTAASEFTRATNTGFTATAVGVRYTFRWWSCAGSRVANVPSGTIRVVAASSAYTYIVDTALAASAVRVSETFRNNTGAAITDLTG